MGYRALFDDEAEEPGKEAVQEDDEDHESDAVSEDGAGHFPGGFAVGPADAADFAPGVANVAAEGDKRASEDENFFQRFFCAFGVFVGIFVSPFCGFFIGFEGFFVGLFQGVFVSVCAVWGLFGGFCGVLITNCGVGTVKIFDGLWGGFGALVGVFALGGWFGGDTGDVFV